MQALKVKLRDCVCDVFIGDCIAKQQLEKVLEQDEKRKIFVITSDKIFSIYRDFLESLFSKRRSSHFIIIADGEMHKNAASLQAIYDQLINEQANRKSLIIAFGGGVIGDLAGFAAASFMRGIDFIQVPTTLLAQVDASIGGKTGINHPKAKNAIGAFKQPAQTIIDYQFLKTLNQRELISGYAEIFKHSLIEDDDLFRLLIQKKPLDYFNDIEAMLNIITKSCQIKIAIVIEDEKEEGKRALLNFGHTIAHFLETKTGYETYLHGEAVFAGCHFASWISMKKNLISEDDFLLIDQHLQQLNLKINLSTVTQDQFTQIIGLDKKNYQAGINYIYLQKIGRAFIQPETQIDQLWYLFEQYLQQDCAMITTETL